MKLTEYATQLLVCLENKICDTDVCMFYNGVLPKAQSSTDPVCRTKLCLTRDGGLKHDKEKVRNSRRKQWNFSPLSSHGKLLNNL